MGTKTSQLQIRVSPSQKAVLKDMAEATGMSVSAYVLSKALPSGRLELEERIDALRGTRHRDEALDELERYLGMLSDATFREAVTGVRPGRLPRVPRSYAAAAVEREASRRRIEMPPWTRTLEPLTDPHFAWELRSLRPHLVRITPPAFKRRRLFVATGPPPRGESDGRPDPSPPEQLLRRYDEGLAEEGVVLELCVVGGAVLRLAFTVDPHTRRPRLVLCDPTVALEARRRAAERGGVGLDRLEEAARELVDGLHGRSASFEGRRLGVLAAPPDYVLAMKCMALSFAPEPTTEDDIRYLLRFLGVRRLDQAMVLVGRYLNPRQRPADLEIRLERLLG